MRKSRKESKQAMPKPANTPIYREKLKKGLRKLKRLKLEIPKKSERITILKENTKRGHWEVTLFKNKVLNKEPLLIAAFFKKDANFASGYLISTI